VVDFSVVGYPGFLDKVDGLAARESWGRWTDGTHVVFHLADELPRRFTLEIDVNSAFATNAGNPITIRAGSAEKQFTVPEQGSVVRIPFVLAADARTIELIPPSPMSPKELGLGNDSRRLGIGLRSMRVLTRDISTKSEPSR
jgi:phosphoglycerol transferase